MQYQIYPLKVQHAFQGNDTLSLDCKLGLILSGGRDKTVQLWDIASGDIIWSRQHSDVAHTVSISEDGLKAIAVAHESVMTWDLNSGKLIQEVSFKHAPHYPYIYFSGKVVAPYAGLSPSGALVAMTRLDGLLGVFDSGTGSLIRHCRKGTLDRSILRGLFYRLGRRNPTFKYAITPDDGILAVASTTSNFKYIMEVYNLKTGDRQTRFSIRRPNDIAISHDGKQIAFNREGVVSLIRMEDGLHIATLCRGDEDERGYSPAKGVFCQSSIVTLLSTGLCEIWNLNGQIIKRLHLGITCEAENASVSPNGQQLAVWDRSDNFIKLYTLPFP